MLVLKLSLQDVSRSLYRPGELVCRLHSKRIDGQGRLRVLHISTNLCCGSAAQQTIRLVMSEMKAGVIRVTH